MVPVISVILIISLSLFVTKIATVILFQTGLSQEAAKFQARSALTGTGFTTAESESITQHPVRRRVVLTLMLVGNAGIVTVMASLLLTFVNHDTKMLAWYYNAAILAGGVVLIWVLSTRKTVDQWMIAVIEKFLKRYSNYLIRDYRALYKLTGDYQISEYYIGKYNRIVGKTVAEVFDGLQNSIILGIEKVNGVYIGKPENNLVFETGDKAILYGEGNDLKKLDSIFLETKTTNK